MPVKNPCLLALDGGGVRGLSSLMVLKRLMKEIDPEFPPKPCDYFDMIGGTSTGGFVSCAMPFLFPRVNAEPFWLALLQLCSDGFT